MVVFFAFISKAYSLDNINQLSISNFDDVYRFYEKFDPVKSQFDTTQQYKEKTDWWNKIGKNDILLKGNPPPGSLPKYDADNKTLDYFVEITPYFYICFKGVSAGPLNLNSIMLSYQSERSTYIGENSFGVKKEVEQSLVEETSIIITNIKKIKLQQRSKYSKAINIKLKNIESNLARKSILSFGLIYKCLIKASPCSGRLTAETYSRLKPTMEKPIDIKSHDRGIYVFLKSVIIYDKETGNVLGVLDL